MPFLGALAVAAAIGTAGTAAVAQVPEYQRQLDPGESDSVAPPVDTLVAWARARSPEIAAARARTTASRQRAQSASALMDPMLEFSLENESFDDYTVGETMMSVLGVELRQDLPWPGKRGARRRAAESAADINTATLQAVERQITSEVQSLCAELYALDRQREILETARETARVLGSTTGSRYAAGTAEMEAQVKAQLAISRVEELRTDATAERRARLAELRRLLGDSTGTLAIGRFVVLPELPPPPADWAARAIGNAPEVRAARAAVEAARTEVAVEESEGRPDLFVAAGYGYRGELDPMLMVRVGTGLPIWSGGRQGPRIEAARQEGGASVASLQQATADTRAAAERFVVDWERAEVQVKRYQDAIVPQTRLAFEAARTSYEAGKVDFSTVIEDFRLWLEAQAQLAGREADRYVARARLEALLAPAPAPVAEGESR